MLRAFRDTIRATGLKPPDHIITGEIIAFPGLDKRPGNTAARAAALACGGKYLIPDQVDADWNDVLTGEVAV